MLVMALVLGIIGCDNGPSDEDTWSDVTSLSQVNGRWKYPSSVSFTSEDITITAKYNNYIVTFNSAAKTMSMSGSVTETISGGNIDELWPQLKEDLGNTFGQQGATVTFNDANHSITVTYNNYSQALTDEIEASIIWLYKINQNRSKLKYNLQDILHIISSDIIIQGTEIILTKL